MAKRLKTVLKIQIQAGKATPAPPVGPALGQHGVNIMAFCKEYNDRTASQEGSVVPVEISIYDDRSFSFITKIAPTAELLKKAAGIEKGSSSPASDKVGRISSAKLQEIAQVKMKELSAIDLEGAMKIVGGTARSMGIEVE